MRITIIVGVFRIFVFWMASPFGFKGITVALIMSYVLSFILSVAMANKHFSKACDKLRVQESSIPDHE